MNGQFAVKMLCAFLAVLAAAALVLMFEAAPSAQARTTAIPRGHRAAMIPSSPLGVTLTVTTTADSVAGSLRQAIASASPGDTINFSLTLPATITLTNGELPIATSMTISGPGASLLAVSGGNFYSVFNISGGNVTISGLTIRDGVGNPYGGGIYNAGTLTLTDSTVISSTAIWGGGVGNNGTLRLMNTTVMSNSVGGGLGGGVLNLIAGQMTVDRSTITGNSGIGGGIFNYGFLTVTNSTLAGNIGNVSGIYMANATLTMSNTTVTGDSGGSEVIFLISNGSGSASATLLNSTIVSSTETGIVLSAFDSATSTLSLKNTIIANNNGTSNFAILSGTVTSLGYNLSDGTIPNATTGDQQNVTNTGVGPLANNGGATQTMALLPGSPAINAGSNSGCPATDQRGIARPRTTQNPCDIGAYEGTYVFLPLIEK